MERLLEAEAGAYRYDSGSKGTPDRSEVRSADGVIDLSRVQVQVVEYVVGIEPQFELRAFAQNRSFGQAESFRDCQVNVFVPREIERIPLDSRRWR